MIISLLSIYFIVNCPEIHSVAFIMMKQ